MQQSLEDTCGLASVADVVGEVTGNAPTEKQIITLAQYLGADRKVIAWVNGGTILGTNDQRTTADHLLVVTGIDTNNGTVHLNDPYADNGDTKVSIGTFMTAWKTGQESIVVTAPAG